MARLLSRLRSNFPESHIAAFTASATQRVRHDILHQLQLRSPHKYIASFHRPNLRYAVKECKGKAMQDQLLILHQPLQGSPFKHQILAILEVIEEARVGDEDRFIAPCDPLDRAL